MNLKQKYKTKLIERILQQENLTEPFNTVIRQQFNERQFKSSHIKKTKASKSNILQKQIKQCLKNVDKQNNGDTFNNQSVQISKKMYMNRKANHHQADSFTLLELSQIQHQNKYINSKAQNIKQKQQCTSYLDKKIGCMVRQNKKKKTRFIDKVKNIEQEIDQQLEQVQSRQQRQIGQRQMQKSQNLYRIDKQNKNQNFKLQHCSQNQCLQESTLTKQIRKDKTLVALFDDDTFKFTIDIQISSGKKVPLQVNQKSNILQISQLFVKKYNLEGFSNLAVLLQKQIYHQIQKQKKQKVFTKYQKQYKKYQRITGKHQAQQVLMNAQVNQYQESQIKSQNNQNKNNTRKMHQSIQEIEEVQYMNLCDKYKQPFLIPQQFYELANHNQKYKFFIGNPQKLNNLSETQQNVSNQQSFQNSSSYYQQQNVQQQINQHQKQENNKKRQQHQKFNKKINYQNCFDKIQPIGKQAIDNSIQKNKLIEVKFSKQTKMQDKVYQKEKQLSNDNKITIVEDNVQKQGQNSHAYQCAQKYNIQIQNQEQEQEEIGYPKINCISDEIVNRLGKNNILLQKQKKNNLIKNSILTQKQQKLQKQLEECSFQPKINLISKFIDKKIKLSQYLKNSDQKQHQAQSNFTHNNESNGVRHFIQKQKSRFDQLYQNSKVISNKKQQIRRKSIEDMSFRPQINTISKKIMESKRNSRQLTNSISKTKIRNESLEFQPKILFHGKDQNYALDRNIEGLPIGQYLYKQAMKLKRKRQSLQIVSTQNFKTLESSEKLIQIAKQRKLQQIFNELTRFSKDQLLYPGDYDLNSPRFAKYSKNCIKYFVPLLQQMKQLQVQLSKSEFIKSALKLFSTLSQNQKSDILNSKKTQKQLKQSEKRQRAISKNRNRQNPSKELNQNQNIYVRGLMYRKNAKSKVEQQLQNKVRKELKQCTFKPHLKNYSTIE